MTDSRMRAAAARRAAAEGGPGGLLSRSADGAPGVAQRSLAFPAQLRGERVQRDDQEWYHFRGVASVTDTPYTMYDAFGEYDEVISRGAFADTLAAGPDVAFLLNHKGLTMARTTNGTLQLRMGESGLEPEAWLNPKRQDVSDMIIAIDDGLATEMSFAFRLNDDWGAWNDDFTQFTINRLDMNRGDVSVVNYGANPFTSIAARSLDDLDRFPEGAARAAMERLSRRLDVTPEPAPVEVPQPVVSTAGMSMARIEAWITLNS